MKNGFFCLLLGLVCLSGHAEEKMVALDIGRPGAHLPIFVMTQAQPSATVVLLPGGDAGSGKIENGQPTSENFLVRSRALFFAAQVNVIVVFRASDLKSLDYEYRISAAHVQELAAVIGHAKQLSPAPVWLVGTSRGTVSGTAAAIALPEGSVQGLVLTSSVTNTKTGFIASQKLAQIKVPTLVVHHKNDGCGICLPREAAKITEGLTSAPVKRFQMVEGGSDPQGNPCRGQHWHGFVRHEKPTVELITGWIRSPHN